MFTKICCAVSVFVLHFQSILARHKNAPNIVFIWFDDLGFNEVSLNGGTFSTPILDNLAENGIVLNQHYSDSICSASRSAFLTGRFSWKTGLNSVIPMASVGTTNIDITLLPKVLKNNYNYNTQMVGKYHIGYKTMSNLPFNRGFDEALFTLTGPQYYTKMQCRLWNNFDPFFGGVIQSIIDERNELFGDAFCGHDLYNELYEAQYLDDTTTYIERIFADKVKQFINKQNTNQPFFIYYSLFTPHFNIISPPDNPDADYSLCQHLEGTRVTFCEQIQYAQAMINEVIQTLKDKNLYDNTIIIITSDNGSESRARVAGGPKLTFGQTLPLRGAKAGPLEGGIRTMAIMSGGYIDMFLRKYGQCSCEYNGLVHISDWYHILLKIINAKNKNADNDHKNIRIWNDIKRECLYGYNMKARDEIITTRMCEDGSYYSTYIRYGQWKLVINGSNAVTNGCPAPLINDINVLSGYSFPDGSFSSIPIEDKYLEQIGNENTRDLYNSECYNALTDEERNDINNPLFQFDEFMLFNIENDKIEACNVAGDYPQIVVDLFNRLKEATIEYDGGGFVVPVSPSAVLTQVNTYDCNHNTTYLIPWNEENPNITDFNIIWQTLIDNKNACSN